MFVLNIFRIRHSINWSFTDSKNFSSTRSIFRNTRFALLSVSFIFFYLVIMEGCSVQTLFRLYRNHSATLEKLLPPLITQLSVSPRCLYSVANTLHLPRLPPPPTLIFLRPPPSVSLTPHPVHPCSPSVTSRYSRRWCQQFANYCPPPLTLVGGTGCRPSSTLPTVPVVATL